MFSKNCSKCSVAFEISGADEEYYKKREVPLPKLCPKCRLQRRLAFRNERNLYKRKSDKTGRDIITNIRPDAPFPVYHVEEEWHKDDWNPPFLPRYDFGKKFFEQFAQLSPLCPRGHIAYGGNAVNSEYINHAGNCKNCYFIFNSEYAEDCMYCKLVDHCRDCVDCTNVFNSELCYECVNVEKSYNLIFSDDCKNCRDSAFLRFCRRVNNSLFCYGLEGVEYHLFNKPVSKEEFEVKKKALRLDTYSGLQEAIKQWNEFSKQFPLRRKIILNCENSTGDSLYNCKNALDCYNCSELEDCRYAVNTIKAKDCYDVYAYGDAELCLECVTLFHSYNMKFCNRALQSNNVEYCDDCFGLNYGFGCVGLKGKSYCIFNKQYTKEEYFDLVKRIKAKMLADEEYGEFFPMELSIFPYEDTLAQDYFPLAEKKLSLPPAGTYLETSVFQDGIREVDIEAVSKNTYLCSQTQKLFRFQKQELEFYKKMGLPLPRVSFEARYRWRNQVVPFPY